jgi:hypothetical protein
MYIPFNVLYATLPPVFRKKLASYFLNGHWIKEIRDTAGSEATKDNQVMVVVGR